MIRIAMVVFSSYPLDVRVRREAEALVEEGISIDLICIKLKEQPRKEKINNINVYRIKARRKRSGKYRYLLEYSYFIFATFLKLSWLHLMKRYHIIHVHNIPDILIISALTPKLTGAKLVLDLHDPMPELYMTKYSKRASHPIVRVLKYLEKFSIRFADLVLTPNASFRNLFISRSAPARKIHIVMNSPQENIFRNKSSNDFYCEALRRNKFVLLYNGYIAEWNGLDTAIEAINIAKKGIPNLALDIYGSGDFLNKIQELIEDLHLGDIVKFHGLVSLEKSAEAIASADAGIIPNKMNPFTNLNFPTRIFEFLIMKKPVIAPLTQGILDYFDRDCLYFFEPGNVDDLSRRIIEVYSDTTKRRQIVERGEKIFHQYRWELQKKYLITLYRNLLEANSF